MINWESILPIKRCFKMDEDPTPDDDYKLGYNKALDDCAKALKAAESRGEICKPLSVKEIRSIIGEEWVKQYIDVDQVCEAIHAAMTRRGE